MAVTKIWAVKGHLKRAIDYVINPEKTEQQFYVSGINCIPKFAHEQMTETKKLFRKEDLILKLLQSKLKD